MELDEYLNLDHNIDKSIESLGVLKGLYPDASYCMLLTILHFANIESLILYGYTLSCDDDEFYPVDFTDNEVSTVLNHHKNNLPNFIIIYNTVPYDDIVCVTDATLYELSKSDMNILCQMSLSYIEDVNINTVDYS